MNIGTWVYRWGVLTKRQIKLRASYRLTTMTSLVSVVAGLLSYGLLGSTAVVSETSSIYGMSLAAYLVSGVAFSPIVISGLGMFNPYMTSATVEDVMVTPIGLRQYLLTSASFTIATTLASAVLSFAAATLLFRLDFSYDVPLLLVVVLLGIVSSIGLGFLGLGFQLLYKQTNVLSWLLITFTGLVGNMIVPVQVLPNVLQSASLLTPQYYFFTGVRIALGSHVAPAWLIVGSLAVYTLFLMGLGLFVLERSLLSIRLNGTHRWT